MVIDAAVVIEGSLFVSNGNVSGLAFNADVGFASTFKIAGSLVISNGYLNCVESASPCSIPVYRSISATGFVYGGNELHLNGFYEDGLQFETTDSLTFPPNLRFTILDEVFPFPSWQRLTFNSTSDVSVPGGVITVTFVWSYFERVVSFGTCGIIIPQQISHSTASHLAFALLVSCYGEPDDLPAFSYPPLPAGMSFPDATGKYTIQGEDLNLMFSFSTTNCKGELEYRREKDWIATMSSAGLGDWFWSICPREKMTFNDTSRCVTYVCDGSFALPNRVGQQKVQDVQDNIIQGIVFDATATGVDVLGTIVEFCLMPLFVI